MDFGQVARDLGLNESQVRQAVELLDDGNTVPFITRFRKDQTGALDEEQIRKIKDRVEKLRTIAERRQTIRRSIELQDKLTDELVAAIDAAKTLKVLEDLYLPYKPRKRSLASVAREKGLGPFAEQMLAGAITGDIDEAAQQFVNSTELTSVDDVLLSVSHIIAEGFAENAELRDAIRRLVWKEGRLRTQKLELPDELNANDEDDLDVEGQLNPDVPSETGVQEGLGSESTVVEQPTTSDQQVADPGAAIVSTGESPELATAETVTAETVTAETVTAE
ncbi:MAG TPA: RNA-binding transcriptional accessory protein, partial [Planctomycetaceae bacterium]|nr:RNA-binding transcriptional accessory protein [Planctomycetaceae bacterium]